MFRVVAEKPSIISESQANQLVDQWLATYTPWADDPTPHDISLIDDPLTDSPQYFHGDLRFERDSSMTTIREQIETDLAGVTDWYRVAYHQCTHDESEVTDCSWDAVTEYGTVPITTPTIQ
jgi:hypothetical protein